MGEATLPLLSLLVTGKTGLDLYNRIINVWDEHVNG